MTVTVTVTRYHTVADGDDDGDDDGDGDALPHCGARKMHGFRRPGQGEHLASCGLRSLWRDGLAGTRQASQRVGPQPIIDSIEARHLIQ